MSSFRVVHCFAIFIFTQIVVAFFVTYYFNGRITIFSSIISRHQLSSSSSSTAISNDSQTTSISSNSDNNRNSIHSQLTNFKQKHKLKRLIIYELMSFMNASHNPRIFLSCYDFREWLCTKILKRGSYECKRKDLRFFVQFQIY